VRDCDSVSLVREQVERVLGGELTPFGGIGILVALGLLIALRLVVPAADRRRHFGVPAGLLLAHVVFVLLRAVLPDPPAAMAKPVEVLGLTLLFVSIGRSSYLLLLYGILERRSRTRGLPGIIRDMVQVGVYLVITVYVLHRVGVDPSSLLTTSAVLTAVIGFALQDTLGNLFAGLAIQAQQPFEVGDWIQFNDDPDSIGEVIEINWRATRVLTNDHVEVTVPNNTLAKAPIRNYSKPTRLVRRHATVIAPYETPPARVHRLLTEAVVEVEGVCSEPPPDIQTIQFTERGVEYRVRYFIEAFEQREVISGRVRDRMWYALRRAAVPMPAPQRRITMIEHNAATSELEHQARIADVERALERLPLFKPLPHTVLHELAMHTERRLYAHGEVVIQQGDHGDELFIVERGQVEVLVDRHAGMEHVATLGPRDFFGEMSLLTGEQRRATVRTNGEVALLVVSKESLQPILEASPELATVISDVLAEREQELGRHSLRPEGNGVAETERRGELLSRIREFFSL
jgi:small-conductance mechanosensitive channel/CRP-like cAMP-binding protein